MTLPTLKRGSKLSSRLGRPTTALAVLSVLVASACSEEVGGDGFQPQNAGKGGDNLPAGGAAEGGAPPLPTGGKGGGGSAGGGKSNAGGGSGGKGGSIPVEGGEGGGAGAPLSSTCGNKAIEDGEQCDDGNTQSGDGCTADCKSDCEVCEKTFCKAVRSGEAGEFGTEITFSLADPFTNCYELPGNATAGLALGVPRAELCRAVVDCARREGCAQLPGAVVSSPYPFLSCLCTADVNEVSPGFPATCRADGAFDPTNPDNLVGKCATQFLEASEYEEADPAITQAASSKSKALGAANLLLLHCDRALCTEECLPQDSLGKIAEVSADILAATNELGESPLGDLLADALREASGKELALVGNDVFANSSTPMARGLLFKAAPGRPADAQGRVLHSEVRHVLVGLEPSRGYVNTFGQGVVTTLKISGAQLSSFLTTRPPVQVSGLAFRLSSDTKQLVDVTVGGKPLDPASTYVVAVNSDLTIPGASEVVRTATTIEQALVDHLKALPQPIAPPQLERVTLAN